jgi:hypothetical protein
VCLFLNDADVIAYQVMGIFSVLRESQVIKDVCEDVEITDQWLRENKNILILPHESPLEMYHILRVDIFYWQEIAMAHSMLLHLKIDRHALPNNKDIINDIINYKPNMSAMLKWLCIYGEPQPESKYFAASITLLKTYVHIPNDVHMIYAAEVGNIDGIIYMRSMRMYFNEHMAHTAAGNGQLDCLKYLCSAGCTVPYHTYATAAKNNHIACIDYLHQCKYKPDNSACIAAAESGHLECLTHMVDLGFPLESSAMYNAIARGHLECAKYIYSKISEESPTSIIAHHSCWRHVAAENGQVDCLKYLISICPHPLDIGCHALYINAAIGCHTNVIDYLHSQGYAVGCIAIHALRCVCLRCIKHLHQLGGNIDNSITNGGWCIDSRVDVLKYVCESGCWLPRNAMIEAVKHGSIKCVEYLCESVWEPYMITITACYHAAIRCNLQCLKYLYGRGYPCVAQSILNKENISQEIIEFVSNLPPKTDHAIHSASSTSISWYADGRNIWTGTDPPPQSH